MALRFRGRGRVVASQRVNRAGAVDVAVDKNGQTMRAPTLSGTSLRFISEPSRACCKLVRLPGFLESNRPDHFAAPARGEWTTFRQQPLTARLSQSFPGVPANFCAHGQFDGLATV